MAVLVLLDVRLVRYLGFILIFLIGYTCMQRSYSSFTKTGCSEACLEVQNLKWCFHLLVGLPVSHFLSSSIPHTPRIHFKLLYIANFIHSLHCLFIRFVICLCYSQQKYVQCGLFCQSL